MRQALRQVREAQGPDAVILSSRRISGGVEVVAAVDYDADGAAHTQAPEQREHTARGVPLETCAGTHEDSRSADYGRKAAGKAAFDECETFDARLSQAYAPPAATVQPDVNEELRTLRRMLETQLATLAWNDLSRRAPTQAELLEELSVLGLAQDLAAELVAQMPTRLELSEAHRLALAMIARRIETAQERWLDDEIGRAHV